MTMMNASALTSVNLMALQNPNYARIMARRPAKKHRVIEIGNGIFFEYWNKDEWEFTQVNQNIDMQEWNRVALDLVFSIKCINPTADKLQRIVKMAKKRFAKFL